MQNCHREELNDNGNENIRTNTYRLNNKTTTTSRSYEYETRIIWSKPANNDALDTEVVGLLKYLINLWASLDLPVINCEIDLDLSCSKNWTISGISRVAAVAANPAAVPGTVARLTMPATGAAFQINRTNFYILGVTLSTNYKI